MVVLTERSYPLAVCMCLCLGACVCVRRSKWFLDKLGHDGLNNMLAAYEVSPLPRMSP